MTQEEKAKAYDEAIERARKWYDANTNEGYRSIFESIFPELQESEDEMIRKKLITFFQRFPYTNLYDASLNAKDVLAWLEKQGEQKPADKVEPKFKVGDTVTGKPMSCHGKVFKGEPFKIVDIIEDNYVSDDGKTYSISLQDGWELVEQKPTDKVEPKFKVGDWVIFAENHNSVYQVERIDNNRYYLRHYLGGTLSVHFDNDLIRLWTIQDAKDGDVLFEDKISSLPSPFIVIFKKKDPVNTFSSHCFIGFDGKFYEGEGEHYSENLHPATKEQRDTLMKAMADAGYEFDFKEKVLKKIEQKPAWSEEDEELCNVLMNICGGPHDEMDRRPWAKCINWLESLKERYTWKPSDEQIEALKEACDEHWEPDGLEPLYTLYQDLKKLREE